MRAENSFMKAQNYFKTFGLFNEAFIKFWIKFFNSNKNFCYVESLGGNNLCLTKL